VAGRTADTGREADAWRATLRALRAEGGRTVTKKVLVVEDEQDIALTIKFALERVGYQVITAADGNEALDKARDELPDVMVLDVMLPERNGYNVSRALKEEIEQGLLPRDIKILILTARKLDSTRREEFVATWARADRYMYKPFQMRQLIEWVGELAGDRAA
jgi:two-component system alkaline phosphatase synthesis response regulator PhoP